MLTQQRGAVVTPGTCAGVTWQTRWTESHTSPFTTAGYGAGYCYRYTVSVTNGAGGTATAPSGNLLITAPAPPPAPSATFTSPALGETITALNGTNTVTWTESQNGGGADHEPHADPAAGRDRHARDVRGGQLGDPMDRESHLTVHHRRLYSRVLLSLHADAGKRRWRHGHGELGEPAGSVPPPPPAPSATFTSPVDGATMVTSNTTNTVTWTESDGGGNGIASRMLTQQRGAVVTPGTCAGVTWQTRWTESHTSPFTTAGYGAGYCYRYTVSVTNGAGGTATAPSGNLLITAPAPPPAPSATFTSPALGETITALNGTNTVTWTESQNGGGPITSRMLTQQRGAIVTPGTCAGVNWVTRWTESHTSPFTTGGYTAGFCYRYTLTLGNAAGGTVTASSGNLLINKK